MDSEYIVAYQAPDELMALSVRDLLLDADVPAMVRQIGVSFLGGLNVSFSEQTAWGEVLVFSKDEERARELIGGFLGDLGLLEEA